jgi:hypothetical protein
MNNTAVATINGNRHLTAHHWRQTGRFSSNEVVPRSVGFEVGSSPERLT